ncbi:MAG: tetraacyldisaccharide 4'-kinase [Helicobacteraceae bacterium]|nr:tetraacyldisaccharide 4'-kinase [Helicobacteraceae bacterium]
MVIAFIEGLLFAPRSFAQKFLVWALSPLGKLAAFWQWKKLNAKKPVDLEIRVVSVGNLTIGGSGKTPLIVALAKRFDKAAIVLRGYGRKSRDLIVLDDQSAVCDVGDEALLYRSLLERAIIIVSTDRKAGVLKAKELGAKVVFLDDGFRHREIKKFDVLIRPFPEPLNHRVLPAGCYRLPLKAYDLADFIAKEGEDFARKCEVSNPTDRMVLVTAISRAKRLDPFLPSGIVAKYAFRDHAVFDVETLKAIAKKHNADSLLVTRKDLVKLENFSAIALSVLELEMIVSDRLLMAIDDYYKKASNF